MTNAEEIWAILREVSNSQKETADELRKLAISQKETETRFKETEARFKETEARFKETDVRFKETDVRFKETSRLIGGLGEGFGSFTEGMAYPSMRKILFEQYGIDNTVANYLKRFPDGTEVELDAFGHTNGTVNNAVIVEVKSNLKSEHIKKFKKKLTDFKVQFPDYANKNLFGIFCTVGKVSAELKSEIFNSGIHLAMVHDNIFELKKNENAIDWNHRK